MTTIIKSIIILSSLAFLTALLAAGVNVDKPLNRLRKWAGIAEV